MLTVFYDGSCGMCHRAVRFLLKRDRQGNKFTYAPLQGETAAVALDGFDNLPDSMVVKDAEGTLHLQGQATRVLCRTLGGLWHVPAFGLWLLPRFIGNWLYDLVAARRYSWFGKESESCPLISPEERTRFLP